MYIHLQEQGAAATKEITDQARPQLLPKQSLKYRGASTFNARKWLAPAKFEKVDEYLQLGQKIPKDAGDFAPKSRRFSTGWEGPEPSSEEESSSPLSL